MYEMNEVYQNRLRTACSTFINVKGYSRLPDILYDAAAYIFTYCPEAMGVDVDFIRNALKNLDINGTIYPDPTNIPYGDN